MSMRLAKPLTSSNKEEEYKTWIYTDGVWRRQATSAKRLPKMIKSSILEKPLTSSCKAEEDKKWIHTDSAWRHQTTNAKDLPNMQVPRDRRGKAELAAKVAKDINDIIFQRNHQHFLGEAYKGGGKSKLLKERAMDCVAVGISHDGHDVLVSGNVKQRVQYISKNKQWLTAKDSQYGFNVKDSDAVSKMIQQKYPQLKSTKIKVVGPKETPTDVKANAAPHAEMQLLKQKEFTRSHSIGISKPACERCADHLEPIGIPHVGEEGTSLRREKVVNFLHPEIIETKTLYKIQPRESWKDRVNHNMSGFSTNPLQTISKTFTNPVKRTPSAPPINQTPVKKVSSTVKQHVNINVKPNVGVSLGSGLETMIDDIDHSGSAYASTAVAESGSYTTRCSAGLYARASTAEAGAKWSVFSVKANGPAAGAGLHTGVGTWAAAYSNAEIARAEASAGPISIGVGLNANTGASIGVDGVSASLLGFGVTLGPKMSIRTPIVDISLCSIM